MKNFKVTSELADKYYGFIKTVHSACVSKGYCENLKSIIEDYSVQPIASKVLADLGILKSKTQNGISNRWYWAGDNPSEMMARMILAGCKKATQIKKRTVPINDFRISISKSNTKDHAEAYVERVDMVFTYLKKLFAIQKSKGKIYNISSLARSSFNYSQINKIIRDFGMIKRISKKGYVIWCFSEPTEELAIKVVDELKLRNTNSSKKHKAKKKLEELNSFSNQARKHGYNPDTLSPAPENIDKDDNVVQTESSNYYSDKPKQEPIKVKIEPNTSAIAETENFATDSTVTKAQSPLEDKILEYRKLSYLCNVFKKDITKMDDEEMESLFDSLSAIEVSGLSTNNELDDVA